MNKIDSKILIVLPLSYNRWERLINNKKGEMAMNNTMIESQRIESQIQEMIPESTYKNIQSAIVNICVPKVKFNTALTEYVKSFQIVTPPMIAHDLVCDMMNTILTSVQEKLDELHKTVSSSIQKMAQINFQFSIPDGFIEMQDRMLFFKIAEEIGFPVYLECDTELQDILIEIYIDNNNRCDKKKMQQAVIDYYDEDYLECICNGITNVNIFNAERIGLLRQGMEVYQEGNCAAANALFITQMGGMIRDIYDKLLKIHKFTRKETNEVKKIFKLEECRNDSEKVMLAEIISEQEAGIIIWYQVIKFFLKYIYSSGEKYMNKFPKRHMICHGIQTNFNKKEMSLKIILCMGILAELALRIEKMIDDKQQVIIDI